MGRKPDADCATKPRETRHVMPEITGIANRLRVFDGAKITFP